MTTSSVMDSFKQFGFKPQGKIFHNLDTQALNRESLDRQETKRSSCGPIVLYTQPYTGRLPQAKFFVREASTEKLIDWGKVNRPISSEVFNALKQRVIEYLNGRDLFIQDCYAGADESYRLSLRVITETAVHSLFAQTMLICEKDSAVLKDFKADFTVIHAPGFKAVAERDGTTVDAFVIISFEQRTVLIGGTAYAGEIKKSVFTIMNFLMPQRNVFPMHCSANYGKSPEDAAIFFGLSGTGKTTLSADPARSLIGDDEHGWSQQGVFNFEGGCYAKVIRLSEEAEPEIFSTTKKPGTLLENVAMNPETGEVDFNDDVITENTRASYPISYIPNMTPSGKGGHPKNVIMLTCDAFGILAPVAKLSQNQAMYHFLSGYTSKVAGTEAGIKEPQPTFSACFGAPFMPMAPSVYARLLGEYTTKHQTDVWLMNTGWIGGPYGTGKRISIAYSRAIVSAILSGELAKMDTCEDPVFHTQIPLKCPGLPDEVLNPRSLWQDPQAYDRQAQMVARLFQKNFLENASDAPADVVAAGPVL